MAFKERMTKEARLVVITSAIERQLMPGKVFGCTVCGTRVRPGQPHRTDIYPAHMSMRAVIVHEHLPVRYYHGELDHQVRRFRTAGRPIDPSKLKYDPKDQIWREES